MSDDHRPRPLRRPERSERPEEESAPPTLHRLNASRTRPERRRRPLPAPPGAAEERRRRTLGRWTLVLGILVAASVIVAALLARHVQAPETPAPPVDALRAADPAALTPVTVVRVVDGATLDVSALGTALTVRLIGVEPPAAGSACATLAAQRLKELAAGEVLLRADGPQEDASGHELRYVYTSDGHSIDATLVSEGLVRPSGAGGALHDGLGQLEDAARAAGRGCVWAAGRAGG